MESIVGFLMAVVALLAAVAAAIFAVGFLWVAVSGSLVLTGIPLLTLQAIVLAVLASLGALALWRARTGVEEQIVKRLAALEQSHGDLLAKTRRQSSGVVATAALGGQAVVTTADKAFEGSVSTTLAIEFGLLVGFWLSTELMAAERRRVKIAGWIAWFVCVLALPASFMVYHGHSVSGLLEVFSGLSFGVQISLILVTIALLLAPIAARARG